MVNREIPADKMEVVRSLMNNRTLQPEDRFKAIIELVQDCPERPPLRNFEMIEEKKRPGNKRKPSESGNEQPQKNQTAFGPTETSYYVDDLFRRYKNAGLVKKRYLVQRRNRIGFWFRKRLIPSKKLLKLLKMINSLQNELINGLNRIMHELLDDQSVLEPELYNYFKQYKEFISGLTLSGYSYDAVKWMEREHFEKELRGFIKGIFILQALSLDEKQSILSGLETRLYSDNEAYSGRREYIPDPMRFFDVFKSFMPLTLTEETFLSRKLKGEYGLNFFELIMMMIESFAFQRPVSREELIVYYSIQPPFVDTEKWDCSEEMLKRAGKDRESQLRKEKEELLSQLKSFESFNRAANYTLHEGSVLFTAASEQWKYVDKKNYDPLTVYEENFLNFFASILNYFNTVYVYFLTGNELVVKSPDGDLFRSPVFKPGWFSPMNAEFNALLNDLHLFRTNNPSLTLSRKEVRSIASGRIPSMSHVDQMIRRFGDFFANLGDELKNGIDSAEAAVSDNTSGKNRLDSPESGLINDTPFTDTAFSCIIENIEPGNSLFNRFKGLRVISSTAALPGLMDEITAFCYQFSIESQNDKILSLINEQKSLNRRIEEIDKKLNDT